MAQPGAGAQFYVTHCTTADSVLNNPGYTVRAASATSDPDALNAAVRYPPYELPIDMWRELPQPSAAPRRLARTDHPDGDVWVVHSSYLPKDSVDRDRSYFSHLLLAQSVEPLAVLCSWGADGWAKSYPPGASKALPAYTKPPVGTLVSDAALTAFLSDAPNGPTDLATTVCPPRLRASAAARRELLARALQALLLLHEEENDQRRRLYIHAEPGVVALVLYAGVRLLPADVTRDITFSTFEPYHRNIRDYKLADVVGTYLGTPEKGLDLDLGTNRGIALDTFIPVRSSSELRLPVRELVSAGVNDMIDLAARGEWGLLPSVHRVLGRDADGLAQAGKAILRARGLSKVDEGKAGIEELLAIQEDAGGAVELKARADRVWPVVKEIALDQRQPRCADVRRAFRELISDSERVKEVWEEAVDAILKEEFRTWDTRWALLREVPGRAEAQKFLRKLVGSEKNEDRLARVPTSVRARMRSACADAGLLPPRPLLVPIGIGELEPLLATPPDWAGYTAFVLLGADKLNWLAHVPGPDRTAMRKRAREFLFAAPAPAIAAYVHAARPYLDTDPAFLSALFKPYSPAGASLMDKLLTTTTLEPGDWMKLCTHVGLTEDKWGEFLLEKDRLANLLVGLGGDGTGKEVWAAYLGLLTHGLVSPDLITTDDGTEPAVVHAWERKVHGHLKIAADRLTASGQRLALALPDGGIVRLVAANNLIKWVNTPATAERDGPDEVAHACKTYEIDLLDLVRVAYKKGSYDRLELPEQNEKLEPIVSLFHTCFPVDSTWNTARNAVAQWLKLSQDCPPKTRAAFQARFVLKCVPHTHYDSLLNEARQHRFEPRAEVAIRHAINSPTKSVTKKPPPRPNPKFVSQPEPNFENEGEPIAEELEVSVGDGAFPTGDLGDSDKGAKRRSSAGKSDNTKTLVFGALCVGALVAAIVAVVLLQGPDKQPGTTQNEQEKKEQERKEQEKKDQERKEHEKKEKEDREKKEKEDREKKDKEENDQKEREERDRKEVAGAGAAVIGFAGPLLPKDKPAPLPPPGADQVASASADVIGFAGQLLPPQNKPVPKPPDLGPVIRAGEEVIGFAGQILSQIKPKDPTKDPTKAVMESLNPVEAKLMRKLQRLRLWN